LRRESEVVETYLGDGIQGKKDGIGDSA
jgi:hypothetical protein